MYKTLFASSKRIPEIPNPRPRTSEGAGNPDQHPTGVKNLGWPFLGTRVNEKWGEEGWRAKDTRGERHGVGGNQHHMVRRSQQLQMRWDEGQDDLKPRVYGLFVVSTLAMCKHAGFKPDKPPGSAQLRAHARNPRPDTSAARPGNGAFPTNNSTPKGLRDDEGYPSAPASPRCI